MESPPGPLLDMPKNIDYFFFSRVSEVFLGNTDTKLLEHVELKFSLYN